jgi:putative transposase
VIAPSGSVVWAGSIRSSLSARGLTTGEIAAHFDEVYDAKVSKETISRITEKVAGELAEWSSRPRPCF